nr:polyprenol phosphomannose-dependent alpha 1,6 mannosyltransferase MptB [Actinoplanes awajinensis]
MSSRMLRWTGFGGAVLLAVAAGIGGHGPAVLCCWLVGTAIQGYAWWSGRDRTFTPRWVLGTVALWSAPFLLAPPYGSRDVYSYACQGELYRHGLSPYTHTATALPCTWLDDVAPLWRDTLTPYGPLFVLAAAGVLWLADTLPVDAGMTVPLLLFRLLALAGMAGVAAGLPALARRCGVPPARALWVALAGPLIGAHLLGGPHNDALMLGFLIGGLALVARFPRHPAAVLGAGALLGCAVAVKATAVVAIPFAILLVTAALRDNRKAAPARQAPAGSQGCLGDSETPLRTSWDLGRGLVVGGVGVGGAAVATFAGITAAGGLGYGWIAGLRESEILVQFSSLPTAVGMTLTYLGRPFDAGFNAVPAARAAALAVLAVALVAIWVRALRYRADPGRAALHGAALALVATVALAPVVLSWYALWPLILLAATTVRTRAVMAVAIVAAFAVLPDGEGLAHMVKFPGAIMVTTGLIVLAVVALRRWRRQRGAAAGGTGTGAEAAGAEAAGAEAAGAEAGGDEADGSSEAEPSTRVTDTSITTRAGFGRGIR